MTDQKILDDRAFDVLFREARTFNDWKTTDVSEVLLRATYDLMKFGPTSANSCPARFVFVKSPEAKGRLKLHLDAGNQAKTMAAPVTAIIAYDMKFYDQLPKLFPHAPDARSWFAGNDEKILDAAFRNGSLQGAYLMLAARALGLDCGPMSGFDKAGVKREFFPDEDVEPNFLCNIGYGDPKNLFPRSPRLDFDEACEIV
ncbi:MAG: nitroreductase family protein [Micavibrio sp.]|nr:nitroreductase family protein [Micavibrio sp.]